MMQILPTLPSIATTVATTVKRWFSALLLGLVASFSCWVSSAHATETVVLTYQDVRTTVPYEDFLAWAEGQGSPDELEAFLAQTSLSSDEAVRIMNEPIIPDARIQLGRHLTSFMAIQFSKILGDPYGRDSLDVLEPLLTTALADDRSFSVLELVQKYPEPTVRIEVSRLNQVHSDADLFVEKVQPILFVISQILEDLVCECNIVSGPALMSSAEAPPLPATLINTPARPSSSPMPAASSALSALSALPKTVLYQGITQFKTLLQSTILDSPANDSPTDIAQLAQAEATPYTPTPRSQDVVLTFGPLARSLTIDELTTLAETGETSPSLRFILGVANIPPENFRRVLTHEAKVDFVQLDKRLNTILGEFALFELGQIVRTHSGRANIQALRSALVLSARDDNTISLLEFLQNYPLPQVYIEGAKLVGLSRSVSQQGGAEEFALGQIRSLEDFLVSLQASAAAQVCECDDVAVEEAP